MTASLQIKKGYYYVNIRYKDSTGKWRTKTFSTGLTVSGNNKRKAEQKRLQILRDFANEFTGGCDMLVSDFFQQWLNETKNKVQPNTYRGYEGNMRVHITPYFSEMKLKLCELKAIHLEDYYSKKIDEGLSAQTVRHHHQNISAALRLAQRKEYILSNPAQLAKVPKVEKFKGDYLTTEQVGALLDEFKNTTIWIPVLLCTYYGLRRSETLGLTWKYVDFENRSITIAKTFLQNTGGDYIHNGTKNNSSYRTLPIPEYMYNILSGHKQWQAEQRKRLKHRYTVSDFVCTWDDGRMITPNYLTSKFHDIIQKSDLPKIRLHDLRHTVASNLLNMGRSIVETQEWLGHSSPSTTLNFYSHIDSSKAKEEISRELEAIIVPR